MPTPRARSDIPPVGLATRAPTFADVRDLPSLASGVVHPAAADLSGEVRGVRPSGGVLAAAGDVVICDGPPPDPVAAGVVGVICREQPPAGYPVPAIVCVDDAPWARLLAELADLVGPRPGRRSAERAREALRAVMLDGRGFEGLSETCRDLLGAPVAVLDEYLDVLAEAGLSEAQRHRLEAVLRETRARRPAGTPEALVSDGPDDLVRVPVPGRDERAAAVIVACLEPPLTIAHAAALGEMAQACALEVGRMEVRTQTEAALRGDLIRELAAGEVVDRASLVRRARHVGVDLAAGAVAMLGRLGDGDEDDVAEERVTRRLVQQTRAVLDMHWPGALVDWHEHRLMVLLPGPRDPEEVDREEIEGRAQTLSGRLIAATRDTVPGLALTLAISRFTPQPERLGSALEEATLALSIGQRLGRTGDVVTFEETGTYKLLFQIFADRPSELAAFYEQTLEPLVRYDEQYQTELVGTLATYLEYDCNLAATAGTLYTHRHTVRYRLDRITELCGLDIGRTDDREKLSLGLKAMRLLGRRVPQPTARETGTRKR